VVQFDFQPNDLHRLNRLMIVVRSARLDASSGGHRTTHAGEGIDFLDYRPYTPGDDFRKVDWTLYGRLRQLFVRLNETSRQLAINIVIDCSKSMLFGTPLTKLHQAQLLACGLGFIGLKNGDRVNLFTFAGGITKALGPMSGMRSMPSLVRFLHQAEGGGSSDLLETVRQLRARRQHKGLVVVLSDFLNVAHCEEALTGLLGGGSKVLAIQVLDRLDRGIGLSGSLRLRDSETGRQVDVSIDDVTRASYQRRFETRRLQLEEYCLKRQQHYLLAKTEDSYLELICKALRSQAVVQ